MLTTYRRSLEYLLELSDRDGFVVDVCVKEGFGTIISYVLIEDIFRLVNSKPC